MPKKKVTLSGPWGSMDFVVDVPVEKQEEVDYKPKTLSLDTFIATGTGSSPRMSLLSKCRHGKEITQCARCFRKGGTYFSR